MVRHMLLLALGCFLLQALSAPAFWPFSKKETYTPPSPEKKVEGQSIPAGVLPAKPKMGKKPKKEDHISVEHLEKLAEKGNTNAMLALGKIYYEGAAKEKQDYEKAFQYFKQAADLGFPPAVFNAGLCYQKGHGVPQDSLKAKEMFYKAADAGVVPALYVAIFLAEEQKDSARVLGYLEALSKTGDVEAMYKAATYLQNGLGRAANQEKAADFLEMAAQKGYAPAQVKLADCYQTGNGRPRNYLEMFNWLSLAAQDGNPEAQAKLGYCYLRGMGIAPNPDIAVQWFKSSAEAKYPTAMIYLGDCYQSGNGVSRNPEKAFKCYLDAARLNDPIGQCTAGMAYSSGTGVKQDKKEAIYWLKKSAAQEFSPAMVVLGRMAFNGIEELDRKPDFKLAGEWFEKACRLKNPEGMVELALLYLYTSQEEADRVKAQKLLGQAAGLGSRRALNLYEKHFIK